MGSPTDATQLIDELLPFLRASEGKEELVLPKLGRLGLRRHPAYTGRDPATGEDLPVPERVLPGFRADPLASLEGAESFKRWVASTAPQARLIERIQELSDGVSAELATRAMVHVPGLGRFRRVSKQAATGSAPQPGPPTPVPAREVLTYEPSPRLLRAVSRPGQDQPMPDGILSSLLAALTAPMFSPAELKAILDLAPPAPLRSRRPEEAPPTPCPPLLKSVYLMAPRLGRGGDRFCLLATDAAREHARREFLAQGPGGLRDVLPFSQAPDTEPPEAFVNGVAPSWLLPTAEQGKTDPMLAWGSSPAQAARQPRLPLSTWVRLFSAECVLLAVHTSHGYSLTPRQLNKLLTAARELARGWTIDPWPEPSLEPPTSPLFRLIHPLLPDVSWG